MLTAPTVSIIAAVAVCRMIALNFLIDNIGNKKLSTKAHEESTLVKAKSILFFNRVKLNS